LRLASYFSPTAESWFNIAGVFFADLSFCMAKALGKKRKHGARLPSAQDPLKSARASGLTYINDASAGIRRKETRARFRYIDAKG
jgi:hypothetical protein